MKIIINDHRKIEAIQEEINKMFPNLVIEFYAKESKAGGAHPHTLVKNNKILGECRTAHNKGTITITPNTTVAVLKDEFSDVYGLGVEIFRRSASGRDPVQSTMSLNEANN